MTKETLNRQIAANPVAAKYAKRIGLLESARKAVGAKPMSTFEKYYAGQLFENIQKGNLYEGYTQPSNVGNFRRDAFNIVSLAIQNTILPEIVSVQPMSTAAQLLPILEIRYGTTKGAVTEGDLVLDGTGAGRTDKFYDSKVIADQKVTAGTQEIVVPFTPVDAGTFKIVEGTTVITDNGDGTLTDGGTIDYANGIVKLNAATAADALMSYTYNNANVPTPVGDVTMGINPVLIEAEEHKIKAVYALTAAYRINKEYGVNMPLEFEKQVANEMNKERERIVMGDIFAQAAGGNSVIWSATPRPGVSDAEHVESLPIAINLAAATIYNRTNGNLQPNFIVAGANVIAYLAKSKVFEANEAPKNGGSFLAGKLGTLAVYQTPALGANDFFMGGIGNEFWQSGYVVGDYMPITYTTPVTLADYTTQQGWVSIYGKKMVNANLYIRRTYNCIDFSEKLLSKYKKLKEYVLEHTLFVDYYLVLSYNIVNRNYYIGGDIIMSSRYNEKSEEEKALIRKKISESQKNRLAKRSKAEIALKAEKQRAYMNNRTLEQKQQALKKAKETRSKKSTEELKAIYKKQSITCKETWKNKSIEEKEKISKLHKDIYNSFSSEKLNLIADKKRKAWRALLDNMSDTELEKFTQTRKEGFKKFWNNLSDIEKEKWRKEAAMKGRKGFETYINKIGLEVHKNKCRQGYYNLSEAKRSEISNKISDCYKNLSPKEKEIYKQIRILHGWKSFNKDKQNKIINKIHYTKKQNNSYGKSSLEDNIWELLNKEYFDIKRQYNYKNYTFDFKVSYDNKYTLVDIHGAYYHNYRPYLNTSSDLIEYEKLKEGKMSSVIANTWRFRDVERYNICKINNISYIRIYVQGNMCKEDYISICNLIKENLFKEQITLYYKK